jgi:small-conductance mechanosensitive channel
MSGVHFFSFPLLLQVQLGTPTDVLKLISLRRVFFAVIVLAVVFLLVRLSSHLLEALSRKVPRARFFFKLLIPLSGFALWLLGGWIVLSIFAPSENTMFAVIASVGLALGLGAQDLIRNFIGGLVILADRPYQLGDLVQVGDALGEVDHIGLRSTKLTTFGDTRVTIPNSDVLNGKAWCSNSGVPDCQVETFLYLPCDTNPNQAQEIALEAAYSSPYVLLAKPVVVLLEDGFQRAPYLRVHVKAYVYDHRYQPRFQSDITVRAKTEFLRRGMLRNWGEAWQVPGKS